jgi:hypothetical protein
MMSRNKIVILVLALPFLIAGIVVRTYEIWGYSLYSITYTRGSTKPCVGFPEGGFCGIEKRKKYASLPGSDIISGPLSKDKFATLRVHGLHSKDFTNEVCFGTEVYFVENPVSWDELMLSRNPLPRPEPL